MAEKLVSIGDAARLLEVCENTLREWDANGTLPAVRTEGGHRRYSLQQICKYLEDHPQEVEKSDFRGETSMLVKHWSKTPYLADPATLDIPNDVWQLTFGVPKSYNKTPLSDQEKTVLAVLLENARLLRECQPDDGRPTSDQMVWLTHAGWTRSRFRKMVSTQPMLGPTGLAYYTKVSIAHEAVIAKTYPYEMRFFIGADFEKHKELYADAVAAQIDCMILAELPQIDYETLMDAVSSGHLPPLRHMYDWLIAPKDLTDRLKDHPQSRGVDLFECSGQLDPDSFSLKAAGGRYHEDNFRPPVFAPYILVGCGSSPTPANTLNLSMRAGWCKQS